MTDSMHYAKAADISAVRDFVAGRAAALGLPEARVGLLILAVSELATNTLQHTGGGGRVSVWSRAQRVFCDITDQGPPPSFGRRMPGAEALRGRGLAIVERVCDGVEAAPVPEGTRIRMWFALP